jgi:hypothetical protein
VSEDMARGLEETLHAALADPAAAEQLAQGRLTGGLSGSGFPGGFAQPATGNGSAHVPVEKANEAAEARRRKAAAARAEAEQAVAVASEAFEAAQAKVADLKQRLDAAIEARAEAERTLREARKALRSAGK